MTILDSILSRVTTLSDRTFSARSLDGITWEREGVRVERTNIHPADNAFYCYVHQPEDLSGSYEMFYHTSTNIKGKWKTAILRTTSEDGLKWDQSPVPIIESNINGQGLQQIRAPHLARFDHDWRLFFTAKGDDGISRIYSAISNDRLAWKIEPGTRISGEMIADRGSDLPPGVSDTAVVNLPDGRLRMYFSVHRDNLLKQNICSAVSADGIQWTVEPGVRIDFGGAGFRFVANNPSVISEKSIWRMYFRGSNNMPIRDKIFLAESEDGLSWQVYGPVLTPNPHCYKEKQEVAHPFVFKTRKNVYRMFYTGCCGTYFDRLAYRYYENIYRSKGIDILYE